MKKLLTTFLALSGVALLMLSSCKKSGTPIVTNGGTPGTLTASTTTPVLDKTKLSDTTYIVNFSFTAPKYNFSAAVTNTLQIDSAGDNWLHPVSVTFAHNVFEQGFSTLNFNNLLLKVVPAGITSKVNVRIQHSLSSTVASYSNVETLTVSPFNLTSWVYITGAFANWNNPGPGEDSLISTLGNGVYTGIINFNATGAGANQFLILPVKGSWTNKYATTDPTTLTPSATVTYNGANNFNAPAANGQYIVTLDLNANTIKFALADYYSVIGSAPPGTAWNTDTFMKYINDGTGTWVVNNLAMVVGEYKFRQDAQWTNSWGPGTAAGTVVSSGATGDGNIQLTTAGNYNITFVQPASTFGSTPLATTTYTAVKQ
jgi:hypothetical protein